ncbi:hemolymph lipopolysaccharide-binding protein [Anabrus simplex]|uniref:hemolymph lipopolysaccharide-binding protein n=1 Tax=Anabrus simplex TaxID=316456 RepID=UPI0035A31623
MTSRDRVASLGGTYGDSLLAKCAAINTWPSHPDNYKLYGPIMELYLSLLLLLGSPVFHSAAPVWDGVSCITPMFTLSVHTERNKTGHWISTINTITSSPRGIPLKIDVDIVQGLSSHNGSELVQLADTATIHSPLPEETIKEPEGVPCPKGSDMSKPEGVKGPPAGYNETDGINHYKFYPVIKTWDDANETCTGEGAHLIVFNSDNEVKFFKNMLSNSGYKRTVHIGVTDKEVEGQFVSILGDPVYISSLTQWANGQPEGEVFENCVVADSRADLYSIRCNSSSVKRIFICEWESSL